MVLWEEESTYRVFRLQEYTMKNLVIVTIFTLLSTAASQLEPGTGTYVHICIWSHYLLVCCLHAYMRGEGL